MIITTFVESWEVYKKNVYEVFTSLIQFSRICKTRETICRSLIKSLSNMVKRKDSCYILIVEWSKFLVINFFND